MNEVNRYASENTCKVLIGNKSDLEAEKKVSTAEGRVGASSPKSSNLYSF